MAFANIPVQKITKVNNPCATALFSTITTAVASNGESSPTLGAYFTMDERDDKYLIIAQNIDSVAHSLCVKASNALQGVNDMTVSGISAASYTAFTLDSGRFKWITSNKESTVGYADIDKQIKHGVSTDGFTEKGKVFLTADDVKVKIAVFALPV